MEPKEPQKPKQENPLVGTSNESDIQDGFERVAHANSLREGYEKVEDMPIDEYCLALNTLAGGGFSRKESPDSQDSLSQAQEFYKYFQHNYRAETVNDALDVLRRGEVDDQTVSLWIDDGLAVNPKEFDAIMTGYPDFREKLESVRKNTIDAILNKRK
jgi:hypothetical protein